jgi:hypothetical protein
MTLKFPQTREFCLPRVLQALTKSTNPHEVQSDAYELFALAIDTAIRRQSDLLGIVY